MAADSAYSANVVACSLCSAQLQGAEPIFHCTSKHSDAQRPHQRGYDLCFECGWKYTESQLDELSVVVHSDDIETETLLPLCVCGQHLTKTNAKTYGLFSTVLCDNCSVDCNGDSIVWHCSRGKKAAEHDQGFDLCDGCARKQNTEVRSNWLSDLCQEVVAITARFVVSRSPSSMQRLKGINKHWYQCLDPNQPNVNVIWEHNLCRPLFVHIPKTLKMRRWDRYYQYRYLAISEKRTDILGAHRNAQTMESIAESAGEDVVYRKFKVIENCLNDLEAVNKLHREPLVVDDAKDGSDGLFDADIGSHGLPQGFEWKLKCPVTTLDLEDRGNGRHFCSVCKKNVFTVRNEREMAQRVQQGECVQFQRPAPFGRTRGRVVSSFW